MIGAAGFTRLLKHKENTVFTTSLYEINKLIKEKTQALKEETADQLVERKLLKEYADYKDVFSKAASDQLAPHRSYDYKILLKGENKLSFSLLYNHNLKEL